MKAHNHHLWHYLRFYPGKNTALICSMGTSSSMLLTSTTKILDIICIISNQSWHKNILKKQKKKDRLTGPQAMRNDTMISLEVFFLTTIPQTWSKRTSEGIPVIIEALPIPQILLSLARRPGKWQPSKMESFLASNWSKPAIHHRKMLWGPIPNQACRNSV